MKYFSRVEEDTIILSESIVFLLPYDGLYLVFNNTDCCCALVVHRIETRFRYIRDRFYVIKLPMKMLVTYEPYEIMQDNL